jgi:hypothetical protein
MLSAATQLIIEELDKEIEHARKTNLIIARGEEVKEVLDPTEFENMHERLLAKYHGNEEKVSFIWGVDVCFEEAKRRGDYSILFDGFTEFDKEVGGVVDYKGLNVELDRKAKFYASKYKGFGITKEEFEQEFRIEVWRLAGVEQAEGKEMFTFYERVMNAIPRRALDYVREITGGDKKNPRNKQIRREFDAAPIQAIDEGKFARGTEITPIRSSEAERIEAKILVGEMLQSDKLTDDERSLLFAMLGDPEASNLQLSKRLGISNHKVKRLRFKLAATLQDFNPYVD